MKFTLSANGSTAWYSTQVGEVGFQFAGTFGGGTMKLQIMLSDGSTVQDVQDASYTSGPVSKVYLGAPGMLVRLTLSGATTPSIVGHFYPSR